MTVWDSEWHWKQGKIKIEMKNWNTRKTDKAIEFKSLKGGFDKQSEFQDSDPMSVSVDACVTIGSQLDRFYGESFDFCLDSELS